MMEGAMGSAGPPTSTTRTGTETKSRTKRLDLHRETDRLAVAPTGSQRPIAPLLTTLSLLHMLFLVRTAFPEHGVSPGVRSHYVA